MLEKNILLVLLSIILVFSISGVYADSNTDKLGSLGIQKIVNNDHGGTKKAKDFSFNLEYVTQNGSYIKQVIPIGNFGYSNWGFAEIPIGSIYKVTEDPSPDYYTEYEYDCSGIIKNDDAACVVINNEKSPLKEEDFKGLEIQKIVNNDHGGTKKAKDFSFNLEITNPNGTKTTYAIQFPSWPYIETSIPIGTPFKITEDPSLDYNVMYSGDCSGIVKEDSYCTIINNDKSPSDYVEFQGLTIHKIVHNDHGGTKKPRDFSANLEYVTQNGSYIKQVIPFSYDGYIDADIPIGTTFKVTEDPSPDYDTKYVQDCFGIVKADSYCIVVNYDKPNTAQMTTTSTGLSQEPSMGEMNNSTTPSDDLNKQCQTNYGAGAYYDATQNVCLPPSGDWTNPGIAYLTLQCAKNYGEGVYYDATQNVCLPPSGDWTNPGIAYLTLQCQTNYGAGAYYDATQNVCLPPSGDWTNPGIAYLTLQCAKNYGEGVYYDATQNVCLPPSGSWVTSTSVPSASINETQTAQTTTCPDGQTLDPTTNKCANTESAPKQVTISNDDLKSLYQITRQYEKATSSLLTLNDYQEKDLNGFTTSSWYTNPTDPTNAIHIKVLDLMIEKQSIDKNSIQQVLDAIKEISDKIRGYAQNQGVDPSILDQIDSTTQNNENPSTTTLRQSADEANADVNTAKYGQIKFTSSTDNTGVMLGQILGNNSPLDKLRSGEFDSAIFTGSESKASLIADVQSLLTDYRDKLTKSEIEDLTDFLNTMTQSPESSTQTSDEKSTQNGLGIIKHTVESLNYQEQNETDSILNYISDTGMGELSPIEKTPPQFLSKHGTYEPSANSNSQSELYDVFVTWVLKSQSGVEYKSAHMIATNHQTGSIGILDLPIVDGVIQFNVPDVEPGTYDFKLTKIDGLPSPADNMIEIIIPHRQIVDSGSPPPAQSTPSVPNITTPPNVGELSVPQNIVMEATSSSGAYVPYVASASYSGYPEPVTCDPSGPQFPLGTTVVTCTSLDSTGHNPLKKSFTVRIVDTMGPAISPFNPHNDTPDDSGAVVYFTTEAIDLVDGPVPVHCDHESGTKFPIGSTIVACTADDSKGNHSERKFSVTITITKSP